ncbi:uncharacterized protein LOC108629359, partial [Ceratina calcarata]|uniref:Uncharacterized protein LOC108629359 n=1 Tax=Ceratina calcarata TaxID=156304 RepID=A0AAJ7J9H3_9HYME
MAELDVAHSAYNQALFETEAVSEEEATKELESDSNYKTSFFKAKLNISDLTSAVAPPQITATGFSMNVGKSLKLPRIELPKFQGTIKEWLPFWSQFKKIHEDAALSKEDKFQYLIQATVQGSRANEIVSSFPPTAGNYDAVITCLKNRFGRDEVVVEFYVRELLGLVLQNVLKGNQRQPLSSLYDKVESNIRALNVLGVDGQMCGNAVPVESSLPEEVLRAWQRSGQHNTADMTTTDADGEPTKDRLTLLLGFLQREVENEERIGMALTGFSLPLEQDKNKKSR